MVYRMAEDIVEKLSVFKAFASRSEVTDGRNRVESSLYHTFFMSTRSRIQPKVSSSE
jgi:hypothetical protein